MKKILKIFLFIGILISTFYCVQVNSETDLKNIDGIGEVKKVSINIDEPTGDLVYDINNIGLRILKLIKLVFEGVLIIYLVYAGIEMIMSMGTDETALTKSKTSIRYSLIALIFINVPSSLYKVFKQSDYGIVDQDVSNNWSLFSDSEPNIFINVLNFGQTLNGDIIGFIEVALSVITIFIIIIHGIKIILSDGKAEDLTKSINKVIWSIGGLIFIGFIEVWKRFVFSGNISDGVNLFNTFSNLALFFAGPVAISFLTLAAYYYITSNGNEDKVKKAKSIVINTVIATVILLASYTLLLDLATL